MINTEPGILLEEEESETRVRERLRDTSNYVRENDYYSSLEKFVYFI